MPKEKIIDDTKSHRPIDDDMQTNPTSILRPLPVQYGKLPLGAEPDVLLLMSIDELRDKRWKTVGSAFPLFHKGMVNLITASHVVEKLSGKPLYVLNPRENKVISLGVAQVLSNADIDVAIIQCSSNELSSLFESCTCVEVDYDRLTAEDSGEAGLYQVYGYPQSKNKISRTTRFDPHMFRISLGKSSGLPKKSRLLVTQLPLLCFDIAPDRLVDNEMNRTFQLGKFDGLSGGPVIRHSISAEPLHGLLVGMFVEWHGIERTAVVVPIKTITTWIDIWCS